MNEFTVDQIAWIEALESGNFKQCDGRLYRLSKNAYCCLGVACRVMHTPIPLGDTVLPHLAKDHFNLTTVGGKIKEEFWDEAKSVIDERYTGDLPSLTLAQLNDQDAPFEYIATLLRQYPYWFFTNFNREYTP